jgi:2-polyprenyl-3-methyl-5-hydroxy-6-metoxy-1,4-benzoquinol methylase
LEQVACNLCGSTQLTPVYQKPDARFFPDEVFTVVECGHCGLGFLNPRPTRAEIAKYYPRDYYQVPPSHQPGEPPAFINRRNRGKLRFLQELERRRTGPQKLLDVGCGNGDFARFMLRRGWQLEAVEISEHAARITEFPVYNQEFQDIPVNAPTYDAITLWAVLEHVHDPMAYFRKAAQVLKPDGRLVFLVHNFHSMASRYLFGEDIPRHLYFYTRETVAQYLQKNGLHLEYEDNGRSIYKMAPAHWLSYLIQTRLRGKPFTFADAPLSSREFRRVHGLSKGVSASLKYLAYSPVSVVERILFPAVETTQILRKTYGVSTYVARKA